MPVAREASPQNRQHVANKGIELSEWPSERAQSAAPQLFRLANPINTIAKMSLARQVAAAAVVTINARISC